MNDIEQRIGRLYAAIGSAQETNPNKLKATIVKSEQSVLVRQDFSGGYTDDEIANQALTMIHNVANIGDNLRAWAARNGKDKNRVSAISGASPELQIIQDLSNNDKHGYPPRDGGLSGKLPRLVEICRVMRMKTRPVAGSTVIMTIGANGAPRILGDGEANAVVTAEVVGKDDVHIGDLREIVDNAVAVWEVLFAEFGLK